MGHPVPPTRAPRPSVTFFTASEVKTIPTSRVPRPSPGTSRPTINLEDAETTISPGPSPSALTPTRSFLVPRPSAPPPAPSAALKPRIKKPAAEPFVELELGAYEILPDTDTVIHDAAHNLSALGMVVNTSLHVFICIECGEGVEPTKFVSHVKKHNSFAKLPPSIVADLQAKYNIGSLGNAMYSDGRMKPVFGLSIEPHPLHFCGQCYRGYSTSDILRSHQTSQCQAALAEQSYFLSYAQILTRGPQKRFFPIDTSLLSRRSDNPAYSAIFDASLPPPPDFGQIPVRSIEDSQNLDAFMHRQRWIDVLEGLVPADVAEATRLPDPNMEPIGREIQLAAHRFLHSGQDLISKHQGLGMTKVIAQVDPA